MKRLLSLLLALLLAAPCALAEEAVEAPPLAGERYFPDGADAGSAAFVFRYALPQFAQGGDAIAAVNQYYQSLVADLAQTVIPETFAGLDDLPEAGMPAYYTQMDYTLAANDSDYLSVLISNRQFLGNAETERLSADVFSMSGVYAGQTLSLSQAIGLEQEDGASATGDDSYAAGLVYDLVWQIIAGERAQGRGSYDPTLTRTDLERVFSPESDFYLDRDDQFVFFIQAGEIASEVEGVLLYPFSAAELLSAAKP